jgi:hypothetical protein
MGISFKDLEKATKFFAKHGIEAKDVEAEMRRLWKANNMDEQFRKAQVDLLFYGKAKIDISNIKENEDDNRNRNKL